MPIRFTPSAYADYLYWRSTNPKLFARINKLCAAIVREPFQGIGKPEPLLFDLQGCWSRRIDRTHRLIYQVKRGKIVVISCRFHY